MSDTLHPIQELAAPKYDRDIDVRAWVGTDSNPLNDFFRARPTLVITPGKEQPDELIFFKNLDYVTRTKIYAYVFEHDPKGKMITLSKDFATKDVFPSDHFLTPWDFLNQVEGALFTCRQMRDELLTFFWTFYKFHVTFSSFTLGPTFSGLSIKWLNLYANRVNHLAVEVDFTKLGFSAAQNAVMLSRVTDKIEMTLSTLVKAIGTRRGKGHMSDLHLMVRRYKGNRPPVHGADISTTVVPYCPEQALKVFDCFSDLKDLVLEVRMSGFSYRYTKELQIKMWRVLPTNRPWPGRAWPEYVPNPPTPHYNHISRHGTDGAIAHTTSGTTTPTAGYASSGSASSPRSTDFISRTGYAPSASSGNCSGQSSPVQTLIGTQGSSSELESNAGLSNNSGIASRGYRGSFNPELVRHFTANRSQAHSMNLDHLVGHPALRATPNDSLSPEAGGRNSLTTALELPNAINALNEQDPAFLRAVEGLKLSSPKTPSTDCDADEDGDENGDEKDDNTNETSTASGTAHGGKNRNGSGKNKKKGKGKKKGRKH